MAYITTIVRRADGGLADVTVEDPNLTSNEDQRPIGVPGDQILSTEEALAAFDEQTRLDRERRKVERDLYLRSASGFPAEKRG